MLKEILMIVLEKLLIGDNKGGVVLKEVLMAALEKNYR